MELLVFSLCAVLCSATNMVLKDGDPCQFWPGSFYFEDFCYKVVNTSTWEGGRSACSVDHHQAKMAQLTSIRPVPFISLYSLYMHDIPPDPFYWLGGFYNTSSGPRWLEMTETTILPTTDMWTPGGDACLVMDTAEMSLRWHNCTQQHTSSVCQIEVPVNLCPFLTSTYYRGSCYNMDAGPNTFSDAKKACKALRKNKKPYLVEINSPQEFNFVALSARAFMYEDSLDIVYTGGKLKDGTLQWTTSELETNATQVDWWHSGEPAQSGTKSENCVAFSPDPGSPRAMLESINCYVESSYMCETDKWEERYVASFPLLTLFPGGVPEVTLTISSLNRYSANTVQLVTYSGTSTRKSTVMTTVLEKTSAFNHKLSDLENFLTESGVGIAAIVITSDSVFVVSFTYTFPGQFQDLFTSSILYPLGPHSSHYFVVTSTAACKTLPVVGISASSNPIVWNPNCTCETFLLVMAVETIVNVTYVEFEFPQDTKLTFQHGGIELEDPSYMRIPLRVYETAFIITESDLSGSFIEASQNVVVYAGYTVKGSASGKECTASLQMMQTRPVTEGDTTLYTAPYELAPPEGVISLENYRVISLADNTLVKFNSSQGRKDDKISLERAGGIREFSLPNTNLYVIESNFPVLVYRLSFAAPNQSTGINNVITPTLAPIFSSFSLESKVEHVFYSDDLDYKHLVIRQYDGHGISADLEMNGELYTASPFSAKEFTVPGASVLRLNVTGLDSIRVTRADDSTSDAQAAAVVCAGRTGASGYCTDLEPLHTTDIRSLSSVNLSTLATRDFHKNPNPVIMYGFDDTTQVEQPATPINNTNFSGSQNESDSSRPEESTSSPNTTGIPNLSVNDTTFGCNITIPDIFNVPLRARELENDMRRLLSIDSRRTSAFIRSKTCAEDNRPSSVTMGAVAVCLIFFAAVSIVTPDIRICTMWMIYRHKRFSRSV